MCSLIFMACSLTQCSTSPKTIKEGKAFEPTRDMVIEGGDYHIPSMDIPEDVNVTFEEDVNLTVDGDAEIAGDMQGHCTDITMQVGGTFNLKGDLSNTGCEGEETADITLNLAGDQPIQLGEEGQEISTDGDLLINIGDVQGLESTPPLPFEPAQESTPPVCTLSTDSLVTDLTEDGYAEVYLWGECLDPDGGIVETLTLEHKLKSSDDWIYALDNSFELHDNGETILGLEEPGVHFVSLTAEDDEGDWSYPSTITVFVLDPALEEQDEIGIAIEQDLLFYEQGSKLQLDSLIETTYPEADLEYLWSIYLEDTDMFLSESNPFIDLDQSGVIEISLEVFYSNSFLGYAERSLYVVPEETASFTGSLLAKPKMITNYDCSNPPDDAIVFRGFKRGRNLVARVLPVTSRPIMILPWASINANDGNSPGAKAGTSFVVGGKGGKGGKILIHNWNGDIVLCNSASFTAGSGGDGGDATANGKEGQSATAIGGNGGKPGSITFITDQFHELVIEGNGAPPPPVSMTLGKAGDGGDATAKGGDGKEDCNAPTNGGRATARGGHGGSAKYTARFSRTRLAGGGSIDIPVLPGRTGGDGGNATATGGAGGSAADPAGGPCNSRIAGKNGWAAEAYGGKGGSAYLSKAIPALTGGNGGNATANGGAGGNASDCPNANNGKDGGKGGAANAKSGKGGKGTTPADNGAAGIVGGEGGKGGVGGKGLITGGAGGEGGKGRGGLPTGDIGKNGDVVGELAAFINNIKVNLVEPTEKVIELVIQFTFPGWDWGRGNPFVAVELEYLRDLFYFEITDLEMIMDESFAREFAFAKPLESGTASLVLIDQDGNRTEAFVFEVEVPEIEATEEPQAQGTPPVITAVEFPEGNIMNPITIESIELPADGTEFTGWIHFEDADGDVSYASFEPMEVDSDFEGFGFDLEVDFIEGDFFDGQFLFHLWCGENQAQQQITLMIMLQDAAGYFGEPAILTLWCE